MAKKKTTPRDNSSLRYYRYENEYNRLVAVLSEEQFERVRQHPLVFWTQPADRGLPMVFIDWPLERLLGLPFDEVYSTPGVGTKKIVGLITLLKRIVKFIEADAATDPSRQTDGEQEDASSFDARRVSESQWSDWRETVIRHELKSLPIGRIARSLDEVPMVIWDTPLGSYCDHTLAQIREMKTHGQKRVRVILEAFWTVHSLLNRVELTPHLVVDLTPQFVRRVEQWLDGVNVAQAPPTVEEVRRHFVEPLLEQLEIDLGARIAKLVSERLGLSGATTSVRNQAKKVGVTRARVYQWLEDCARATAIRWPRGAWKVAGLLRKLESDPQNRATLELVTAVADIFLPER
ncbi:MAG: hypothetical protein KDA42_04490 [Planctomycetales bacterium]|nr:hypothetical protein [Planctomycetales bacterium]